MSPISFKQNVSVVSAIFLTLGIASVKGGTSPWFFLAWSALVSALLVSKLLKQPSAIQSLLQILKFPLRSTSHIAISSLALFQAWALLQALFLSPDSAASLNYALLGIGMLALLALWATSEIREQSISLLYRCIVAVALIQCLYGLWIYLTQTNMLLWMPKIHYLDRPTGLFVNANHFAAYLVITILLCVCRLMNKEQAKQSNSNIVRLVDTLYNPNTVILGFLCFTLIATRSVGAILSLIVALTALFFYQSPNKKRALLLMLSSLIVFTVVVLNLNYATLESEIGGLAHTIERRIEISTAAAQMLKDHWLLGVGGGSFYSQFSPYRTLDVGNAYYNYAHNDWIQFWIEYGVIGIFLLSIFMTSVIQDNLRVISEPSMGIRKTFAYASIFATVAVAIHSAVDFPLHAPGFSVLFLVIISVNSLYFLIDKNNKLDERHS